MLKFFSELKDHVERKVLARRVSSCPMAAHFLKKYKENSLNLL